MGRLCGYCGVFVAEGLHEGKRLAEGDGADAVEGLDLKVEGEVRRLVG